MEASIDTVALMYLAGSVVSTDRKVSELADTGLTAVSVETFWMRLVRSASEPHTLPKVSNHGLELPRRFLIAEPQGANWFTLEMF